MNSYLNQLRETSKLLQLFYHRNKNQHRHSKWWKWLAMLKRCVNKLTLELEASDHALSYPRVTYMKHILLPKCYVPFTQLIQDNQFAAVGLVLLGELAKTQKIINSLSTGDVGTEGLPTASAEEIYPVTSVGVRQHVEDVGESIRRELSNTIYPLDAQVYSHMLKDVMNSDGTQCCSSIKMGHPSDQRSTRSHGTMTESGDDIRGPLGSAKTQGGKPQCNEIDQLFQGLA